MALDLILPDRVAPSNLHLPAATRATFVDGDMFDICKRMREIDEHLFVVLLEDDATHAFAIMESCDDGLERLVFKVKELDGRVLERLRMLMAMPLDERLKRIEADEHRFKLAEEERQHEELYERLGRPMWTEMDRCGFIPGGRPVSYPKRGVTGGRGSLAKS